MSFPTMKVSDQQKMGELIKHWSNNPGSEPNTIDEFLQQVANAGFEVTFQGYPNDVPDGFSAHRQPPMEVLYINIPDPNAIAEASGELGANSYYPLPDFYDDAYVSAARRTDMSDAEIKSFNLKRLAEYTTNKCQ